MKNRLNSLLSSSTECHLDNKNYTNSALWCAFATTAIASPEAEAIRYDGASFSFHELYDQAIQMCSHLRSSGVLAEERIGIYLPKSIGLLAHVLACWKIGASVLIFERNISGDELNRKIANANLHAIIGEEKGNYFGIDCNIILAYEVDAEVNSRSKSLTPIDPYRSPSEENSLACMVFTSGSTSLSKCVGLSHLALLGVIRGLINHYDLKPESRIGWSASLSFDSAIAEPLLSLISGATLVIPRSSIYLIGRDLENFVNKNRITHMILTPSVLETADPNRFPEAVKIALVGEPLSHNTVRRWANKRTLYNAYGPSEASICATVTKALVPNSNITVGKPLPGVEIMIIDEAHRQLPPYSVGEVAIGGVGVSYGYLNNPRATKAAFIDLENNGSIFHCTGDIGFVDENGDVVLQGRKDDQVKINGRRVDLTEVENVLNDHESIKMACVAKAEVGNAKSKLVAYLVLYSDTIQPEVQSLREHASIFLPRFMIPTKWYVIDNMPININGKLDKKSVSSHVLGELAYETYSPISSELEKQVAEIFTAILDIEKVGRDDDFFALGGVSIDTIRVIEQLRQDFSVTIEYISFMRNPTVTGIAKLIREKDNRVDIDRSSNHYLNMFQSGITYRNFEWQKNFPRKVFLTGATGFLGQVILEELLADTSADIVIATRFQQPNYLIPKIFGQSGLSLDCNSDWSGRVRAVYFDLEKPIGVDVERELVDADLVIHCAAQVNLAYDYASLKNANVLSTLRLLNKSSFGTTKRFIYISSRSAVDTNDSSGYGKTKLESEKMVADAFDLGLTGFITRPGRITSHTARHYFNQSDFIYRFLKACCLLGMYPEGVEVFWGVPVNVLAKDIVKKAIAQNLCQNTYAPEDTEFYYFKEIFHLASVLGSDIRPTAIETWIDNAQRSIEGVAIMFPDVLVAVTKYWDEMKKNYCMKNHRPSAANNFERLERTRCLILSILKSL